MRSFFWNQTPASLALQNNIPMRLAHAISQCVHKCGAHDSKTLTLGMHDEKRVAKAEPLRCKLEGSIRKGACPMKSLALSVIGAPTMQVARYIVEACHMKTKAACSKSPCQAHSHFRCTLISLCFASPRQTFAPANIPTRPLARSSVKSR